MATAKSKSKGRGKVTRRAPANDRERQLVQAAERRAKVVALLNQENRPMKIGEIVEKTGLERDGVNSALVLLRHSEQIDAKKPHEGRTVAFDFARKGYFDEKEREGRIAARNTLPAVIEHPAQVPMVRHTKRKQHEEVMPMGAGVEIVIGGIPIAIERNPVTGRPRVVIS